MFAMRWPQPPKALMNRSEFSEWTGIPYNTIRGHERAGRCVPLDYDGRPAFTADHLVQILKAGAAGVRTRTSSH